MLGNFHYFEPRQLNLRFLAYLTRYIEEGNRGPGDAPEKIDKFSPFRLN